jgi:hypothetical protein
MVAFIPGPKMAREILAALGIEAASLVIAKARAPPHQESFELAATTATRATPAHHADPAAVPAV